MNNDNNRITHKLTVRCVYHEQDENKVIGKTITLKDDMTFGRATSEVTPDISVPENISEVSARQGVFMFCDNTYSFIPLSDTIRPTLINGEIARPGHAYSLSNGDIISIPGDEKKDRHVDIHCKYYCGMNDNLHVMIKDRKVRENGCEKYLLKDIDFEIKKGELVLFLGGSGAGKTTLMNAIMGYEKANGVILYDGRNLYEYFEDMKYSIGYVPQQDLVRMGDTVENTLYDAARMRLKKGSRQYYASKVANALSTMNLTRERKTPVGKLSGGQRKRLSIAIEYIGEPSLFFLDEPDSGLDGEMATDLMLTLKQIAEEGKTVIVISHSPNRVAELFDKVIVLAKSKIDNCGRLAFCGSVDEAKDFFNIQTREELNLESVVGKVNSDNRNSHESADYYINRFRERRRR